MSGYLVNTATGEKLLVELALGDDLWLRNEHGAVECAKAEQLPAERWTLVGTDEMFHVFPALVHHVGHYRHLEVSQ